MNSAWHLKIASFLLSSGAAMAQMWTQLSPPNSPPATRLAAMVYDAAQGNVVMFGGSGPAYANFRTNNTWVWDGSNWSQLSPPNSPSPRDGAKMVYDPIRQELVLYGGTTQSGDVHETWVWDGLTWTNVTPTSATQSPDVGSEFELAYDSTHSQVVLFGGFRADGSTSNETWVWDGTSWTNVTPSAPSPSPAARYGSQMAFDSAMSKVVLFGGYEGGAPVNDTWAWDGSNWTNVTPTDPNSSPSIRGYEQLAFDTVRNEILLFGGNDNGTLLNDTWVWNGTIWVPVATSNPPPARYLASSAYDITHSQFFLFGGVTTTMWLGDTWVLTSPPATGTIQVTTNLAPATFTISGPATYSGGGTSFSQSNAPVGNYTISFNSVAQYLTPPTQTGTLTAGQTVSFSGTYMPVTLTVCPQQSPRCAQSLSFTYQQGSGGAASQQVSISSNATALNFGAAASSTGGWLSVTPAAGTAPGSVTVSVASTLSAGTYTGSLSISSSGATNSPVALQVMLTVTPPSRQITLTSITGWKAGASVQNAQWQGQPRGPHGAPNSGKYFEFYAIEVCQQKGQCKGNDNPDYVVSPPPQWQLNGTGFCPASGCKKQIGSLIFSDPSINPVPASAIKTWTPTQIVFTPSFVSTISYQYTVNASVTITITTPDGVHATLPLPIPPGASATGVIATIATRGYGQCTWYVANQRLAHNLPIPIDAYQITKPIDPSYMPQQWDVIDFTTLHTAIIISPVTANQVKNPDGSTTTTYSFTIGEMNVGTCPVQGGPCMESPWSEEASTVPSTFVVVTSASGAKMIPKKGGILSFYSTTKTATAYFQAFQ